MNITTHVCRGNYHSTYASSGTRLRGRRFCSAKRKCKCLLSGFDDERSGGFAPLAKIGSGQKVVLGLITTKQPQLENKEAVIARIHEAAKVHPLLTGCISARSAVLLPARSAIKLTEEEQWANLALVKEIAEEVWG